MVSLRLLLIGLGEVIVVHGQAERVALAAYPEQRSARLVRSAFVIPDIVRPRTNPVRPGAESAWPHAM
jgi:hypothetical protein